MELNVEDFIYAVKHNIKILILFVVFFASLFLGICTFIIPSQYEVSTKVFLDRDRQEKTYDYNEMQVNQKLLKTYKEIIESNDFISKAIQYSDISLSTEEVLQGLTVKPYDDIQIITISYRSTDVVLAEKITYLIQNKFFDEIDEIVPDWKIKVVDNLKKSKNPVSPNKQVWIASGVLIGIFIGMIFIYILEIKRDRFKSKKIIEEKLFVPVIAVLTHKNNMEE